MTRNAMGPPGKATSQGISRWVCQLGLLLEAPDPVLQGGGWRKIADLIRALSAPAVRRNEIY